MQNISIMEWIIGGGGLLALFIMVFKNNSDVNTKVSRVYQRLDEYKSHFEDKHVSKDICQILHKQIKDDVAEIKADVKTLIRKSNGGVK